MIVLLLGCVLGFADLDRAGDAYGAGLYGEALRQFENTLSRPGTPEGPVLYNMGNCAFRLGRYAEAMLLYRRAKLRLPRDPEIDFNLELARQRLGLDDPEAETFGAGIEALVEWFTPGEFLALVGGLETAGLVGLLFLRRRRTGRNVMLLILFLALAGAVRLARDQWFLGPPEGIVLKHEIAIRAEPHIELPVHFELEAGEAVRVEERSDRWIRLEHAKGSGWTERSGVGVVE
jgi:tetratricopeptide (TPR) repeat protein